MTLLHAHNIAALLLFLAALAAVVFPPARRVVVYVLALQIVLGLATWWSTGLTPPAAHWILALLVGGVWPMAAVMERRGRPASAVAATRVAGALIVAYVIYLGMHALHVLTPSAIR